MIKFIKKKKWTVFVLVLLVIGVGFYLKKKTGAKAGMETVKMHPEYGPIQQVVSTTGVVQPQNRLEIKPSVGGRIEKIFFQEGDTVKAGDVLALLSSTERSSLLDAAKLKDAATYKYWEEVYKPIPLVSPIDGQVIVRNFEPGQTVTTADAVLVLSDRLIVQAQVDETDIGYVRKGQKALLTLDAYPDIKVEGVVSHISFESVEVNNVTIYDVDIIPDKIPDVFRSGMSANVEIIRAKKDKALLLPSYVIQNGKHGQAFVRIETSNGKTERARITTGITDDSHTEIVSGLKETDTVVWTRESQAGMRQFQQGGTNPFLPQRRRK